MVLFNHSTRELTAKIVYYGPGLCGKTTNLRLLHEKLDNATTGRLLSLSTAQDRTIYFDLLPVELGNVKGYTVRFQLCTVPGQVFYNETRKLVLKGVDGIVFVVDSQWSMLSHNLESFQNLRENMVELGQDLDETAVVVQYNKRDLPGVLSVQALQESLGFQPYPYVESVAADAKGVVETFKLVSKMTFVQLLKRLQRSPDGERLGPDWVAPLPPSSQQTVRIPAVGAELFALTSTVGPAPAPPTESPFETTASWPAPAKGEVFGDATAPPFPADGAPAPPPSPLEARLPAPLVSLLADAEDTLTEPPLSPPPTPASAAPQAPAAALEPEPPYVPFLPPQAASEAVLAHHAPPPPAPPPPPALEPPPPPPAAPVWAEAFAGLSSRLDELVHAREEESARLATFARDTHETLEMLPGAVRTLVDSLDGRIGELRASLETRLAALESAVARLESSDRLDEVRHETAEVRRLVEERLEEAGGQSRRLSGFLRRALEELEPGAKS